MKTECMGTNKTIFNIIVGISEHDDVGASSSLINSYLMTDPVFL